ncbi:CinA family protein [Microbacterium sp. AR7-10]|uniref:CinA family protein n=1 Tax=Microbacterium sp. AR7-10 TaxID=1891970 RepID=UPI0008FC3D1E|nr:CinA family protein [Microbacterium sp. AR7-10]OIU87989.1 damage-inducible protein CinA [Microbacterium sp. AR7-10]
MTQAELLVAALRQRGWTLGVAESLTGGAVCSQVVSVPGASATLLGGVVAYATPVKHTLLGVDAALLAEHGAVHPDVAAQMAQGVRRAVAVDGRPADVGIGTTGIAGPDSPDGQPVGTVHIGIASPDGVRSIPYRFEGTRAEIRERATVAALAEALAAVRE